MTAEPRRIGVLNATRGNLLGDSVRVADRWWSRLRGLLLKPPPIQGEGLLLVPSRGVHMYGMKTSLDILMLDRERRVLALYPGLPPGRRTAVHSEAHYALELPTGTIAATGTEHGDLLEWVVQPPEAVKTPRAERATPDRISAEPDPTPRHARADHRRGVL